MTFHKVEPADREWIMTALRASGHMSCEESFANLLTWGNRRGMTVAQIDGTLVCFLDGRYSMPIGQNRESALCKVANLYNDTKIRIFGVEEADFSLLERHFRHIRAAYRRAYSDYIYSAESLANLTGKKLAAKRNHINAFEKEHPDWTMNTITADNLAEVTAFQHKWEQLHEADDSLTEESEITAYFLEHFAEIGLDGLTLTVDGQIVAYSLGEPITDTVYCVHTEKALPEVRGAYQMINRQFVRRFCADYTYINREDDTGKIGLRHAKLSYMPTMLVHKYEVEMERK